MKAFVYMWGIGGVLLLLIFAIYRLAPMALALQYVSMSLLHWGLLLFSVIYMAYAEGYKGFHLGFAPRVVKRALYLIRKPKLHLAIFAPVFCIISFENPNNIALNIIRPSSRTSTGKLRFGK